MSAAEAVTLGEAPEDPVFSPKECDDCGGRGKCLQTRYRGNYTIRRYGCKQCPNRWTTYEVRQHDAEEV